MKMHKFSSFKKHKSPKIAIINSFLQIIKFYCNKNSRLLFKFIYHDNISIQKINETLCINVKIKENMDTSSGIERF